MLFFTNTEKDVSIDIAVLVANAMISSQLDYYYSLLYGVIMVSVAKLQVVQRALSALFSDHIRMSPVIQYQEKKFHFIPISYHILFKYNLTFKSIDISQPPYL